MMLGASAVVALAMGVPLAERWLFAGAPTTVQVTDVPDTIAVPVVEPLAAVYAANTKAGPTLMDEDAPARHQSDGDIAHVKRSTKAERRPSALRTPPALGSAPAAALDAAMFAASAELSTPAPPPPPPPAARAVAMPVGPIFQPTQVDRQPQVTSQVEPRMPDALRDRGVVDLVIVRVLVSQIGQPAQLTLLRRSKSGPTLDAAVLTAVRQWEFAPAQRRGQAVSCWYNIGVPLRAEGARATP